MWYTAGKLLAPVVSSVVLHPLLGAVAVQHLPPLALRQAANIMAQPIGMISPSEAAISRQTASVPLLRVLGDCQPTSYWPGGITAPMHTSIDFWQGGTG